MFPSTSACLAWNLRRIALFHLFLTAFSLRPGNNFRNFAPTIPHFILRLNQNFVFFFRPCTLFNSWVKVVEPSFAALLSDTPGNTLCNFTPLGNTKFDAINNNFIFILRPWTFYQTWAQDFLPSMKALNVAPLSMEKLCRNAPPVFWPNGFHSFSQLFVLVFWTIALHLWTCSIRCRWIFSFAWCFYFSGDPVLTISSFR